MIDWAQNTSLDLFSRNCLYTFREKSFARKKLAELRNKFWANFGETSPNNKLLLLPKKYLYLS